METLKQRRPMTPCERGVWIDAEGSILPVGARGYSLQVVQRIEEKEVLEDYCAGALKDGISRCKVEPHAPHVLRARIEKFEDVAKEILLTKSCIRTKAKQDQIQRFIQNLLTPRTRLYPQIMNARKILGLPQILPEEKRKYPRKTKY